MCNRICLLLMPSVDLLSAWRLRGVVRGDSSGHRRQELLSLLLHQAGSADDLVARRPQVWPVHLLGEILHRDLQVRLMEEQEEEERVGRWGGEEGREVGKEILI